MNAQETDLERHAVAHMILEKIPHQEQPEEEVVVEHVEKGPGVSMIEAFMLGRTVQEE